MVLSRMIKVNMQTSVPINQFKLDHAVNPVKFPRASLARALQAHGRTMHKRDRELLCTSASVNLGKRGGEPVYAHGDINVSLEDPDNDRQGKRTSGRIVVVH